MNPVEIILAEDRQRIITAIAAGAPIQEIARRIVGPSLEELGEGMRDRIESCFAKTVRMIQDAGITPQAASPKILFPLLEGASLEENEDLHTMFAALLANASSPENAKQVRPGFIAILKAMAPDEAVLLKWIHANSQGWTQHTVGLNWSKAQAELGFTSETDARRNSRIDPRMATCLDALEAQQLIRRNYLLPPDDATPQPKPLFGGYPVNYRHLLTDRGRAFIEACRPPKPKEND